MTTFMIHTFIIISLYLIYYLLPLMTKSQILFGVRVGPETFRPDEIKSFKTQYYLLLNLLSGPSFIVYLVLSRLVSPDNLVIILYLFVPLVCGLVAYLITYKAVLSLKASRPTNPASQRTTIAINKQENVHHKNPSLLWLLPAGLISGYAFIDTLINYDNLPQNLPINMDLNGVVTTLPKTLTLALAMPLAMLMVVAVFTLVYWGIQTSKVELNSQDPMTSLLQQAKHRAIWKGIMLILANATVVFVWVMHLSLIGKLSFEPQVFLPLTLIYLVVVLGLVIGGSLYTGQSGFRLRVNQTDPQPYNNKDDDQYWKLGLFYVNKNDPSIFVEKRMSVGWTINFGNPLALVGFVVFMVLVLSFAFFIN